MQPTQENASFPSTCWTLVLQAGASTEPQSQQALEELCRQYWPPLYAFLRRSGRSPAEAMDLVQGYLARLIEREDLGTVSRERGCFRSYLLAGLRNHLVSELRRRQAEKRGGKVDFISIEADQAEVDFGGLQAGTLNPDQAFDRRWAETVLGAALDALSREQVARGKAEQFKGLRPLLAGEEATEHAGLAETLGMSPGALAITLHRLRLRLRELVRAEVAKTVDSPERVEEEMRSLLAALTG